MWRYAGSSIPPHWGRPRFHTRYEASAVPSAISDHDSYPLPGQAPATNWGAPAWAQELLALSFIVVASARLYSFGSDLPSVIVGRIAVNRMNVIVRLIILRRIFNDQMRSLDAVVRCDVIPRLEIGWSAPGEPRLV